MTLYLKATVGRTSYLIAATQVLDVGSDDAAMGNAAVDCRPLFGEPAAAPGCRLVVASESAEPVTLIVDRVDGLVELDDDEFRPLPPIGRFGAAFDAVSVPGDGAMPALRLRVGPELIVDAPARS